MSRTPEATVRPRISDIVVACSLNAPAGGARRPTGSGYIPDARPFRFSYHEELLNGQVVGNSGRLLPLGGDGERNILTFQGVGGSWTDITNYGSNMSAACVGSGQAGCVGEGNGFTPDIVVSFQTDGSSPNQNVAYMQLWNSSDGDPYGDLPWAAFGANAGQMYITLTPTNGALLVLNSFDLAGEADSTSSQSVVVEDGAGTVLFDATGTVLGGSTHSTYTPDITASGQAPPLPGR